MKKLILILSLFTVTLCHAQTLITINQAKDSIGKEVTVCSEVKGTSISKTGTMFIYFGNNYPDQTFSAIIYSDVLNEFSKMPDLKGKNVCINGTVKGFKGKPEIEIEEESQITIQ